MIRFLLGSLLFTSPLALAQGLPPRVLAEVGYEAPLQSLFQASFTQTERHSWIGTPGGIFRFPLRIEQAPADLVALEGSLITNLESDDRSVWVLRETADVPVGTPSEPSLLRTDDDGASFVALDDALETCLGAYCRRMSGSALVFEGDRMFYAAGGNVLATDDGGASWVALVGFLEPQVCYDPSIEVIGDRVLVGGECPLDVAYVRAGMLKPDSLEWSSEPADAVTPVLENRNVQFIRHRPDSSIVFAGIEGALLRSVDLGASFEFVLWYDLEATKYPYVGSLLEPSGHPGVVLIGGFDKAAAANGAWLALSRDGGTRWREVSPMVLQDDGFSADSVSFLEEDSFGRILAGVVDVHTNRLRVVELEVPPARRRPVRRDP